MTRSRVKKDFAVGIDDNATSTAITIDASENVGVGDTAPDVKLKIKGGTGTIEPQVTIESTAFNAGQGTALNFSRAGFTQPIQARISAVDNGAAGSNFIFSTKVDGTAGALTERMRIDSNGKVGINNSDPDEDFHVIGTVAAQGEAATSRVETITCAHDFWSTPSYAGVISQYDGTARTGTTYGITNANLGAIRFQNVANGLIGTNASAPLVFATLSAERMRIDSSGRLLVGTTSWVGGATNSGIGIKATSTSASVFALYVNDSSNSNILNFRCDGSAYNTTGSWGTISDERLKENIVDATPKLDDVLELKVRNFNFINDENKIKQLGFVAQEIEQVFPSMVAEDDEGFKSVKTTVIIPMLVKAIQEQQAIIDSQASAIADLTARLEALEAN
jgi:chorismate mutase